MATGRNTKLTGATGEYLVAAELCRRGLMATTFTGNVPDYDIVATDSEFRSVLIQVKAITGNSWQFDFRKFCEVSLDGKTQILGKPVKLKRDIICVMVALEDHGNDRFYVLRWSELRRIVIKRHKAFLDKHHGVRPRKHDSFHCAVSEDALINYKDNWKLVEEMLSE
jgi:hypothetical protein